MDLTLYQAILQHLPEPPDLSVVQEKQPISESWPLLLKSVQTVRKRIQSFTVSDGKHTVVCVSVLPEVYNRIAVLELGTIIHLMGAETTYDDKEKRYILDVHTIYTLKEYDDFLREQQQLEAERLAWLREQQLLEEAETGHPSGWDG